MPSNLAENTEDIQIATKLLLQLEEVRSTRNVMLPWLGAIVLPDHYVHFISPDAFSDPIFFRIDPGFLDSSPRIIVCRGYTQSKIIMHYGFVFASYKNQKKCERRRDDLHDPNSNNSIEECIDGFLKTTETIQYMINYLKNDSCFCPTMLDGRVSWSVSTQNWVANTTAGIPTTFIVKHCPNCGRYLNNLNQKETINYNRFNAIVEL